MFDGDKLSRARKIIRFRKWIVFVPLGPTPHDFGPKLTHAQTSLATDEGRAAAIPNSTKKHVPIGLFQLTETLGLSWKGWWRLPALTGHETASSLCVSI